MVLAEALRDREEVMSDEKDIDDSLLFELYRSGMTVSEIARRLGVAGPTLRYRMRQMMLDEFFGIPRRKPGGEKGRGRPRKG